MSSSFNIGAVDRQLKKIYDCLNIGSNKKAVQEVDRLPKNVRDLTVFKALKALALIRMQKILQALEILNDINLDADLDEVTLQTMTSCCKESVNVGKIVEMYEAASKRKPNDLDIMSHLFMAYVRMFNFKRQKEVAMQMYKNFSTKKRLHSFWAIMSLVMQAQVTDQKGAPVTPESKVCLSLAEKMCEKMIDEERTQEEIELYLTILRKQNKHEEEYKFLTGPICSRLTDHLSWYKRRQAYLCLDLRMYSRAFKHYFPTLIQEYPDQIEYYQGLFKSAFLLDTEAPSQQQPVAINDQQPSQTQSASGTPVKFTWALPECFDIVERQCQISLESIELNSKESQPKGNRVQSKNLSRTSSLNTNRKGLLRGPFIARIELYSMVIDNEKILPPNVYQICKGQLDTRFPNGLNSLILEFFQLFSKKVICYYDLAYILNRNNLSMEEKESLLSTVEQWVRNPPTDLKPYDKFHIELNYHMLRHSLHVYKTSDSLSDRLELAKIYVDLYDSQRELAFSTNVKTEFLPVDHYCLLAINGILTNSIDSKTLNHPESNHILTDTVLISLIMMCEIAATNSPSNHQLKLTLLKLYSLIGASKQSSEVLISLDIKHFQIDTLGHLLNPVLYNTGNYNLSKESLDTCLGFYAHGIRECFECLTSSYREGRFSRVEEISKLLRKLSDSLNAAQCLLIKGVVNNTTASTQEELSIACLSFDPFKGLHRVFRDANDPEIIQDSRDFKILKSLHFETDNLIQERQRQNLSHERLWLKLRFYLLRSTFKQFELFSTNISDAAKAEHRNELEYGSKVVEEMIPVIMDLVSSHQDSRSSYLEPESSPFKWTHVRFVSLINLVRLLVFRTDLQSITTEVVDKYHMYLDEVMNNVDQQLTSVNSLMVLKQTLTTLTITLEFLSLCVTSLVSLNHIDTTSNSSTLANNTHAAKSTLISSGHQQVPKPKLTLNQISSKTEAQLLKMSNSLKSLDPKTLILDKVSRPDDRLMSGSKHTSIELKDGSPVAPLMGLEASTAILSKVKSNIIESYTESLREIESTCKRKIKLLRSKA